MTRAEPQQARARATREKVIAAARALYNDPEVGRDRLDTNAVAARAGVSIGTVYRYFDDRVDILDLIAPTRDYPSLELLAKAAAYGAANQGFLPPGEHREIIAFLEDIA